MTNEEEIKQLKEQNKDLKKALRGIYKQNKKIVYGIKYIKDEVDQIKEIINDAKRNK